MADHWYQKPPDVCADCGETWDHASHKHRCSGIFSGFGPGFVLCELESDHDGPHLLHPWNGSEWLVDVNDLTKAVQTRPSHYESETHG